VYLLVDAALGSPRDWVDYLALAVSVGALVSTAVYVALTYRLAQDSRRQLKLAMRSYGEAACPEPAVLLNYATYEQQAAERSLVLEWEVDLPPGPSRTLRMVGEDRMSVFRTVGLTQDRRVEHGRVVQVIVSVHERRASWVLRDIRVGFTLTDDTHGAVDHVSETLHVRRRRLVADEVTRQRPATIDRIYI
jgi:hypothetical protein